MNIQLQIPKPLLRCYLDYLFNSSPDGSYRVTKSNDFGAALCSFVRYSNKPVQLTNDDTMVKFVLPKVSSLDNARNYFLYYNREDQLKLNDILNVLFNIDFDRYLLDGKKMGYKKKDIIQSYIFSRKLSRLGSAGDTLKKREYRHELQLLNKRTSQLINKADYRNSSVRFEPENLVIYSQKIFP